MTRDKPIHYVPPEAWNNAVTVHYGTEGFDTLCGRYVYDSKRDPQGVTPHESTVTCAKCLKRLRV